MFGDVAEKDAAARSGRVHGESTCGGVRRTLDPDVCRIQNPTGGALFDGLNL